MSTTLAPPKTHCLRCGKPAHQLLKAYGDKLEDAYCDNCMQDVLYEVAAQKGQNFISNTVRAVPNPLNPRPVQVHYTCIACGFISAYEDGEEAKQAHVEHSCKEQLERRHGDWAGFQYKPKQGEVVLWVDPAHETTNVYMVTEVFSEEILHLVSLDCVSEVEAHPSECRRLPEQVQDERDDG